MDETRGRVEVEVKAPVDELESVRERLIERGAEEVDEREEVDTYFAHPGRSFAETDEALRVRRTGTTVQLTYKGPRVDGETKTREEAEVEVDDADEASRLLTSLGFEPAGRVVKQRRVFRLGDASVTLDRVEGLGAFVEVETVVEEDVDQARSEVLALADALGLDRRERRSYLELLLEQRGEEAEGPA